MPDAQSPAPLVGLFAGLSQSGRHVCVNGEECAKALCCACNLRKTQFSCTPVCRELRQAILSPCPLASTEAESLLQSYRLAKAFSRASAHQSALCLDHTRAARGMSPFLDQPAQHAHTHTHTQGRSASSLREGRRATKSCAYRQRLAQGRQKGLAQSTRYGSGQVRKRSASKRQNTHKKSSPGRRNTREGECEKAQVLLNPSPNVSAFLEPRSRHGLLSQARRKTHKNPSPCAC